MSRALAITTAILTILHSYYVSAQAPSCLPGFEWVRRQLERKLYLFFFWFGYYRRSILWTNHHALWQQLLGEPVLMAVSLTAVNFLHRLTQCSSAFTLAPLEPGFVYLGPTIISANSCRCSTVYYSLLSACAYCQNGAYLEWIYLPSTECPF